jgi:alcohol dehydrogenase
MAFNYYMPARILFGKGKLNELHSQRLPGRKALIVISAGSSMKRLGILQRLEEQLDKAGAGHVLFDRILPNPIKQHVTEGAALAREAGCDFVIGLGGGSSIDSAKSIAVMAANPGDYWDYISGGTGKGLPVPNDPLPVVAITTTAGTGTEADPWTVITNGDEKIGFGYDKTFPVLSVVAFRKLEFEFLANIKSPNASNCLPQISCVKDAYSSVFRTFCVLVGIFERSNAVTCARDAGAYAPFRFP